MPRRPAASSDFAVWRVNGLQDLELQLAEREAANRAPHLHAEFEIAVIERGAQRVRRGGVTALAAEGTIVVIPPGEVHAHEALPDTDSAVRSFFPDLSALSEASSVAVPVFREIVVNDAELGRYIGALHRMLASPGSALARETHAVLAATTLVQRHGASRSDERSATLHEQSMQAIRDYLNDHVDANVSLGRLCELARLPSVRLVRAFAQRFGLPPHAYHIQVRVNRAKRLLAAGRSAADVAHATGFVDQSHLTRHFRRFVGVTPGTYAAAVKP